MVRMHTFTCAQPAHAILNQQASQQGHHARLLVWGSPQGKAAATARQETAGKVCPRTHIHVHTWAKAHMDAL